MGLFLVGNYSVLKDLQHFPFSPPKRTDPRAIKPKLSKRKPAGSRPPGRAVLSRLGPQGLGLEILPEPNSHQTLARSAPSPARPPWLHLRLLRHLQVQGLRSRHPPGRLGSRSSAGASLQEFRYQPRHRPSPSICWVQSR
jgi:hypothetical protein